MHGIREYNSKINSLKSTRKITSSMKMISSVKLQRFMKSNSISKEFWDSVENMGTTLISSIEESKVESSLLYGYSEPTTALILLITGNRGLCGQYNKNAIKEAMLLKENIESNNKNINVSFAFIGSKGKSVLTKRNQQIFKSYDDSVLSHPDYNTTSLIAEELIDLFTSKEFNEIWVVQTIRESSFLEKPVSKKILPIFDNIDSINDVHTNANGIVLTDESPAVMLDNFVKIHVKSNIHRAVVESGLSEHSARMSAMDSATGNCDRMIDRYTQLRNRARQSAITTELSEIVTGKEALEN